MTSLLLWVGWRPFAAPTPSADLIELHLKIAELEGRIDALHLVIDAQSEEIEHNEALRTADAWVAGVERSSLSAEGVLFEVEGGTQEIALFARGAEGVVKASYRLNVGDDSVQVVQYLERGVPCYAEFLVVEGELQRWGRIWLADGDEVLQVEGGSWTVGSGELPAVDPGELPRQATQLFAHTLKEADLACRRSDAVCALVPLD